MGETGAVISHSYVGAPDLVPGRDALDPLEKLRLRDGRLDVELSRQFNVVRHRSARQRVQAIRRTDRII